MENDEPMTINQVLALVAIVTNNVRDKSLLDPADHFGIAEEVRRATGDEQIAVMQEVLRKECGIFWNGTQWLWDFLVSESIIESKIDRSIAQWGLDQGKRQDAWKIVKYWRTMKCGVALGPLEAARKLLASDPVPKPIGIEELIVDAVEVSDVL